MELNQVMRTTFAARAYTEQARPDEVLYDIIDNARFAPSDGNRQGNRVVIIRDLAIVPDPLLSHCTKAAVVLVFVVDLRKVASMDQRLDRVNVISDASIYPFVWNVLLDARQAGFCGTLTTLPTASEPEVLTLLNIPEYFAVCAVTPLGKPVTQLTKLKRRRVEDIAI